MTFNARPFALSVFLGISLVFQSPAEEIGASALAAHVNWWYSLRNIKLVGSSVEFEYNSDTGAFDKQSASARVEVLLEGLGSQRLTIKYEPLTTKWNRGSEPFFIEHKTIAFNGKYWIEAIAEQGPQSKLYPYNRAVITGNSPYHSAGARWETGEMFLLGHLKIFNRLSLKDALESKSFVVKFGRETLEGLSCATVEFASNGDNPIQRDKLWLSDSHGGALIKRRTEMGRKPDGGSPSLVFDYKIEGFLEATPGVFLPKKAFRVAEVSGAPKVKVVFELDSAVLNLSDQDVRFDPVISPGWRVEDNRFGTSFIVGDPPAEVIRKSQAESRSNAEN